MAQVELKQTEIFRLRESKLNDRRARTIIATRLARLAAGLAGDVSAVGSGISELRIHYGPGYCIYFHNRGNTLVLLLCGGRQERSNQ